MQLAHLRSLLITLARQASQSKSLETRQVVKTQLLPQAKNLLSLLEFQMKRDIDTISTTQESELPGLHARGCASQFLMLLGEKLKD